MVAELETCYSHSTSQAASRPSLKDYSNRTNYPNTYELFWPKITKKHKANQNKYSQKTLKANSIIRRTDPEFKKRQVKKYLKEGEIIILLTLCVLSSKNYLMLYKTKQNKLTQR